MNSNALLLIPILLIGLGLLLLSLSRRKRQEIQMPIGTPIYQDSQEQPGTILYSKKYRLKGKPDFLLKEHELIIPVEAKTGKTPRSPYIGHIMQLIAYCVLVEETYGVRPPYGFIRYPAQQFRIEFTQEREQILSHILADMQAKITTEDVHRSHNNLKVCASCGFREWCDERLGV